MASPGNWKVPEIDGDFFAIRRGSWRLVWNPDALPVRVTLQQLAYLGDPDR